LPRGHWRALTQRELKSWRGELHNETRRL
jgi:hypothetical protein